MKRLAILLLSAFLFAGCGSMGLGPSPGVPVASSPSAPAFSSAEAGRAMIVARSGYNVAASAAIAYGKLPMCSATQRAPCHDATLLRQMQKADNVAFNALDAADTILRQPQLGDNAISTAVAAAQSALAAFTSLTGVIK